MKECPVCRTSYTDDSLKFCLADGSRLSDLGESPTVINRAPETDATIAMASAANNQVRVDIPQSSPQAAPVSYQTHKTRSASSGGIFKVLVVLLLFALVVVIAAAAGLFIYLRSSPAGPVPTVASSSPSPTPAKDDKGELRDQIANLQKMLDEQKRTDKKTTVPLTVPDQSPMTTTARVNSPGDGFLALRTLPNSELGDRILKIPHGAVISVGECGPLMTPAKRSGRWCQAMYNGYRGWVFDAYLIY